MNSIMGRWVQTCRRELLDRTLIWNQRHLLHALREFEQFYNRHRPHQGIANARPLFEVLYPGECQMLVHHAVSRHSSSGTRTTRSVHVVRQPRGDRVSVS
jgi:putative transposase